jgi:hypothetical protein
MQPASHSPPQHSGTGTHEIVVRLHQVHTAEAPRSQGALELEVLLRVLPLCNTLHATRFTLSAPALGYGYTRECRQYRQRYTPGAAGLHQVHTAEAPRSQGALELEVLLRVLPLCNTLLLVQAHPCNPLHTLRPSTRVRVHTRMPPVSTTLYTSCNTLLLLLLLVYNVVDTGGILVCTRTRVLGRRVSRWFTEEEANEGFARSRETRFSEPRRFRRIHATRFTPESTSPL